MAKMWMDVAEETLARGADLGAIGSAAAMGAATASPGGGRLFSGGEVNARVAFELEGELAKLRAAREVRAVLHTHTRNGEQ